MASTADSWIADAARLPVGFAQVREDARLDLELLDRVGPRASVLIVASGGCTAAALAASPGVARLHVVDPNHPQIALTRLKLHWLQTLDAGERLALLGHAPMPAAERGARILKDLRALNLRDDVLGPRDRLAELGPDHLGRYEALFAELRRVLRSDGPDWQTLLNSRDVEGQNRLLRETDLGARLDAALEQVLALPHLVALFGEGATGNRRIPFHQHFGERFRATLQLGPAATNPYLWQVLLGRYPPGVMSPWLEAPMTPRLPDVSWAVQTMNTALATRSGEYDFVHLSNILDWLDPREAQDMLRLASESLRPGGWVIVRQLNSTLPVPDLGACFSWDQALGEQMLRRDRSFFYRAIHVGVKR